MFAPNVATCEALNHLCCLWPNLDIVVPPPGCAKDDDAYDMAKIKFLVE